MYLKANQIVFCEVKDTRTGEAFILKKYDGYEDEDDLKQSLKTLNWDYPVDEEKDEKVSTKDIDNKELLAHIEYVIKLCAENDIILPMVQEDWDLMIQMYNR
tara:strand:- start:55 stop:360 length:306 start_codon:yes stop_codon:yes gene_type:complete